MSRNAIALHGASDEYPEDSFQSGEAQRDAAMREIARPTSQYLHWPIGPLAHVVGGMSPGEVHFGAAFSGGGKTLFTVNMENELLRQGKTIYHIGLETRPALIRLHFACLRLGYYVGDVVSGAAKSRPEWPTMETALRAEIQRQRGYPDDFKLIVNNDEWLNVAGLRAAMEEAAFYGCDLVVIDHIDHLSPMGGEGDYQTSRAVIRELNTLAQRLQLRVFALSQLNNTAVLGDRLAVHKPPQPQHVYMGGHKRQIATTFLGIYRPLKENVSAEHLKAVREDRMEPSEVTQPDTMAISILKHRHYGSREGKRVLLSVDRGRLV